jgi:hypothetical protein
MKALHSAVDAIPLITAVLAMLWLWGIFIGSKASLNIKIVAQKDKHYRHA